MSCKPTYKGKRYNSLEELYRANGVNEQQKQQAIQVYSQYLDTIFPESKVKDIVYHGTPKISKDNAYERLNLWEQYQDDLITEEEYNERIKQFPENPVIEKFDKSKIGSQSNSGLKKGFYFSTNKKVALWNESNNLYRAIVNSVNPQTIEGDSKKINFSKLKEATEKGDVVYKNTIDALENNTELLGDTIVVQEPEQIHILGSKQDIEGFKNFISGQDNITQERLNQIQNIFNENPKLNSIGTLEQYSQYLDTIFPDSKVKDIVYHGTTAKPFERFDKSTWGSKNYLKEDIGFYFTSYKDIANSYAIDEQDPHGIYEDIDLPDIIGRTIPVILNINKLKIYKESSERVENKINKVKQTDGDGVKFETSNNDEFIVFEPEQIHILGSKQDIEGFKAFVESNNTKTNNSELIDKNTESEIKPIVDAENKTIKNNYETFKEVQDFFDSNLSTMDNIYNAIFNNSEITPDDVIKQIIKTDNVEKECNGGVSNSSWEIV